MVKGSTVRSTTSVKASSKSAEGKVETMTGLIRHSHKSMTLTISVGS